MDTLLSQAAAARLLNWPSTRFSKLMKSGQIVPAHQAGKLNLFTREQVEEIRTKFDTCTTAKNTTQS